MKEHIIPHTYRVSKEARNEKNRHRSLLIWFTGLSGSGKSTIANVLEQKLYENDVKTYTLDGDNIRSGINKGLSFSPEDRSENIRRIAEVSKLMIDAGLVVLAAFVSPYRSDRAAIRNLVGEDNFIEVFVNTSLEECERRDVKGLYAKAREGLIKDFTGIDAPYEAPIHPDVEIHTEKMTLEESVNKLMKEVIKKINYE